MIWTIVGIICIGVFAWLLRKGIKGTAFERKCPCTPHVEHLRWLENGEKKEDKKRENLW